MLITDWQSADGAGQYVPTTISTYAADRTTTIETTLTVTTAESGDDTLTPVNHHQRCRYGSNNYVQSAVKQWLNSSAATFAWTAKLTLTDLLRALFRQLVLNLLDADLTAVIGAVDKQVAKIL